MLRAAALALGALLAAASPSAAQDRTIDAGALRATVSADRWRVEFADARGVVLREVAFSTAGPTGTLGFASGGAWFHATGRAHCSALFPGHLRMWPGGDEGSGSRSAWPNDPDLWVSCNHRTDRQGPNHSGPPLSPH